MMKTLIVVAGIGAAIMIVSTFLKPKWGMIVWTVGFCVALFGFTQLGQ